MKTKERFMGKNFEKRKNLFTDPGTPEARVQYLDKISDDAFCTHVEAFVIARSEVSDVEWVDRHAKSFRDKFKEDVLRYRKMYIEDPNKLYGELALEIGEGEVEE